MAERNRGASRPPPTKPTISLPPRPSSMENFLTFGINSSPGPMTLVSNFFSDADPGSDYRSFSQLLAGAMGSPLAVTGWRPSFYAEPVMEDESVKVVRGSEDSGHQKDNNNRVKNNRPLSCLMIAPSPMFTIPPGLSPATLLESPRFFLPGQSPYGISHQQALAQVTAQAAHSQSFIHNGQAEYLSSLSAPPAAPLAESSEGSQFDQRSQLPMTVDKPADDGYNWRKYGQKQVKGSEYPRSYYKCTHPSCPVKKKVERSLAGHVTEIIYKGKHNHDPPPISRRSKENASASGNVNVPVNPEMHSEGQTGHLSNTMVAAAPISRRDSGSFHATPEQLSVSDDDDDEGGASEVRAGEGHEDEREAKRRNTETRVSGPSSSHSATSEPKIIVQTTSEVDILDDGYRWRKYGQKVVKGNPYPRSYYKCTNPGCNVRKHVERASTDPKAVITTYEGKHNHDVPAAKNSSHSTTNNSIAQLKAEQIT